MIRLEDITPDNWRTKLEVGESLKPYVANSKVMLARAYAYRAHIEKSYGLFSIICKELPLAQSYNQ